MCCSRSLSRDDEAVIHYNVRYVFMFDTPMRLGFGLGMTLGMVTRSRNSIWSQCLI